MKAKRDNYVKPLSYVIETEQALMATGSPGTTTIPISPDPVDKPGRFGVRRYEDYEEEEEDDWSK